LFGLWTWWPHSFAEYDPHAPSCPNHDSALQTICDAAALNQDISDAPWYGIQINGKGYIDADSNAMEPGGSGAQQPLVINVRKGKRYRMRVIGGMSSWALKVNVTGHGMQVIALDGRPVTPRNAQAVVVSSGERFDFVLNAGAICRFFAFCLFVYSERGEG